MFEESSSYLFQLEKVIKSRKSAADPSASYVASLLCDQGSRAREKLLEEAEELILAAQEESRTRVVSEAADLIFHALVLLAAREVQWAEVVAELERRSGTSGWVEKEMRVEDES
ncbi:MAG: phosphoribosyl-ATP diphosphatase [Planctomycetota bacterium]|jgi:phosphoribosyl-ATP pyrophosphohydrolase|nr:phosphoribosyl-ATP diphosphatase [Planctomycetota bacterium]